MRQRLSWLASTVLLAGCAQADDAAQALLVKQCGDSAAGPASVTSACTAVIGRPELADHLREYAFGNRAIARRNGGDLDGALADVNAALALRPDSINLIGLRGAILGMRGDQTAAMRDFERAIALDPNRAEFHSNLATSFERIGQADRALPLYEHAIALDPEFMPAVGGRCWVLAVLDRDLDRAAADCDRVLAQNPQDYNSYNSRGFVRFRQGRHAEAIADYDRALAGEKTASSYYVRGLAKRALGHTADGDADIAQARALQPGVDRRFEGFGVAAP